MHLTESDVLSLKEATAHVSGILSNYPTAHPRDKVIAHLRKGEAILKDVLLMDRVSKIKNP